MADNYVSGSSEMSLDSFVSDFQEQRSLYWLRKIKAEKMDQLLKNMRPVPAPRSSKQNAVSPPYISPMPTPRHPQSLPSSSAHQPYPVGPLHSIPPSHPDPRRTSNPAHSMPPYPQRSPQMPVPPAQGHPFPAAAFSSYPSGGVTQGYPPPQQRPPHPHPYGSYPANAY